MSPTQLGTVAAIAAIPQVIELIQEIVNAEWVFDYTLTEGCVITGTPNDIVLNYSQNYNFSGTIIPGVPSYTITPAVEVPPVMSPGVPAVPGWGTVNMCAPFGNCTTSVPGTPAIPPTTITPGYTIPAVMSPAVPALTGGYSSSIAISVTVKGLSAAVDPVLQTITLANLAGVPGTATEAITYNVNGTIDGSQIQVTGSAAVNSIAVTIGGTTTNLGNISTGTINMSPVPNIPLGFDAVINVPPYNVAPPQFAATATTVAYTPIPAASSIYLSNLSISTGVNALASLIDTYLLAPLTTSWDALVCPLFSAVGVNCPTAPTQTLATYITQNAAAAQTLVNTQAQIEVNALLADDLTTIQPYVQPIITTGWNIAVYTTQGPSAS